MQKLSETLNEQAARTLFDSFEDPLAIKIRWHYLHARIEARQNQRKDVPSGWQKRLDHIEDDLLEYDVTPADLLKAVSSS